MNSKKRSRIIYEFSYNFLQKIAPNQDLNQYFLGDNYDASDLTTVYVRLLHCAQNYQRLPNVIQFDSREKNIRKVLHNYDLDFIEKSEAADLYYEFRKEFNVTTKDSKMNLWYRWSCSVVDSARFLNQFDDIREFKEYVSSFQNDIRRRIDLPNIIASNIRGIGFALACDFLKELGYLDYAKPDVHLMDMCEELGLSSRNQYEVLYAITQIALDNNITVYQVDKILWLICSGNFYKDNIRIESHKDELIFELKKRLS